MSSHHNAFHRTKGGRQYTQLYSVAIFIYSSVVVVDLLERVTNFNFLEKEKKERKRLKEKKGDAA